MYEYIKGELAELTPTTCVVEASGVGYALSISLTTYSVLQPKLEKHEVVKVYAQLIVREDEHLLFGFANRTERSLFNRLTSVSGVGANTARTILSSLTPTELIRVVTSEDVSTIKSVKGIGLKTAQKIIIDLKDKLSTIEMDEETAAIAANAPSGKAAQVRSEALTALTMLGFQSSAAEKVVSALLKAEPDMAVEKLIKEALKRL